MSLEPDAEHIVDFPLRPFGSFPQPARGWDAAPFFVHLRPDPEAVVVRVGVQVVDHVVPGSRLPSRVLGIVDRRYVRQTVVGQFRLVPQERQHFRNPVCLANGRPVAAEFRNLEDIFPETFLQLSRRQIPNRHVSHRCPVFLFWGHVFARSLVVKSQIFGRAARPTGSIVASVLSPNPARPSARRTQAREPEHQGTPPFP